MEVLARLTLRGSARDFALTAEGWGSGSASRLTAQEERVLGRLQAAWSRRAGYLPRGAQVQAAADLAGLEVAYIAQEAAPIQAGENAVN